MKAFIKDGIIIVIRARKGEDYESAIEKMKTKWNYTGDVDDATKIIESVGDYIDDSEYSSADRPTKMATADSPSSARFPMPDKRKISTPPPWKQEKIDARTELDKPYWKRVQETNNSGTRLSDSSSKS